MQSPENTLATQVVYLVLLAMCSVGRTLLLQAAVTIMNLAGKYIVIKIIIAWKLLEYFTVKSGYYFSISSSFS